MFSKSQSFASKTPNNQIPESERAWQFSGSGNMWSAYVLRDDLIEKEKQNVSHHSNHE